MEDLGLVPREKRLLRRMYNAFRTEGYRNMIPTRTFRQSLRGAVSHLESSHPLTGEFRAEVQLTQDTDAVYVEVRSNPSPKSDFLPSRPRAMLLVAEKISILCENFDLTVSKITWIIRLTPDLSFRPSLILFGTLYHRVL
mmetsp:Transcript_11376/g.47382  ORF Transcript_11376/g.47382 Transcript_11376/m.47382 type:complete len:140 (+) Transcript_11376:476-895(+)